jgi:peroxiredoxin
MIKKLFRYFSALLIITSIMSCGMDRKSFKISCQIDGLKDGTVLELIPGATHKSEKCISQASVSEGKFQFDGELQEPRKFLLVVSGENHYGSIPIIVEPGDIVMTAKVSIRQEQNKTYYDFEDVNITGSKSHREYLVKTSKRNYLNTLYEDYHVRGKVIIDSVREARLKKDQNLLGKLYKSESWKKFEQDEKNFFDTADVTIEKMILENADSWWGPFLMMDQMSYFTKDQKGWWDKFSEEAKNSYYGQLVSEELFPVGFKEKEAPEFKVTNDKGEEFSSKALFKGKKYILIDFWASWCKPCRNEIPNFKKAYEMFSPKGFEIISISTDKSTQDWKKALSEENLLWPNFLDRSDIATNFKVKLIPSTFLVDEKGMVLEENLRGETLIKKLEELLP